MGAYSHPTIGVDYLHKSTGVDWDGEEIQYTQDATRTFDSIRQAVEFCEQLKDEESALFLSRTICFKNSKYGKAITERQHKILRRKNTLWVDQGTAVQNPEDYLEQMSWQANK